MGNIGRMLMAVIALSACALQTEVTTPEAATEANNVATVSENSERVWKIESQADWETQSADAFQFLISDGLLQPKADAATFTSQILAFETKHYAQNIVIEQSEAWENWQPVSRIGPLNRRDAPVFLPVEDGNYWIFAKYEGGAETEQARIQRLQELRLFYKLLSAPQIKSDIEKLEQQIAQAKELNEREQGGGFAALDPNQTNGVGGLELGQGGYHAWQSSDMHNWVHHGSITDFDARWVTTAEFADDKFYFYYDNPNDQDPHLYIDEDLFDGVPGENLGMVFADPTDGSDVGVIRLSDGRFHFIYEDWTPINASQHAWDSPLAGHAVSPDGIRDFEVLAPAIDHRTEPTGEFGEYYHPHMSALLKYERHAPEQPAYGDWTIIQVGEQFYLFGDYDPIGAESADDMSIACFTSESIDEPFRFCGNMGTGHPDPTVGFAEGQFYILTQTDQDFVSPGPWVGHVETRVGVDTNGDSVIDEWGAWYKVKETYDQKHGFARVIQKTPAMVDLSNLPGGFGFQIQIRTEKDLSSNNLPKISKVQLSYSSQTREPPVPN